MSTPPDGMVFNVRDFGAVGDKVTDDTAAFQAAIDACNAAAQIDGGQRRVEVPGGDYVVGALSVPEGLVMWGDGSTTSVLYSRDAGQTTLSVVAATKHSGTINISGLGFLADGQAGVGIALAGTDSVARVIDVRIADCLFSGFDTGVSLRLCANVWLEQLHASACTTGFRVDTSADVRAIACYAENGLGWGFRVSDDGLHGASGEGVYLTNCTTNVQAGGLLVDKQSWGGATGCSFTSCDGPAVLLDGHGWRITAPEIATAKLAAPGIVLAATAMKCVVSGGYFALNSDGIVVNGSDNVISGNILEAGSTGGSDIVIAGRNNLVSGNAARTASAVSIAERAGAGGNLIDGNLVAGAIVRAGDGSVVTATNYHVDPASGVVTPVQVAPVVATADYLVAAAGQAVPAGELFAASDGNGDVLTYGVRDDTADPASGHWTLDGVAQPAGRTISVDQAGLAGLAFVAGSVADALAVRAADGVTPIGDWTGFSVAVESATPLLRIAAGATVDEAQGRAVLAVVLDRPVDSTVTVAWSVVDGTATVAARDMPAGQQGVLTFLPGGALSQDVAVLVNDRADQQEGTEDFAVVLSGAAGASIARAAGTVTVLDHYVPAGTPPLLMTNVTTGAASAPALAAYAGPVSFLAQEFLYLGADDIVLAAAAPNLFLRSGAGNDALAAMAGQNVLDAGTGSNFLTGGSGMDDFFLDARDTAGAIWSTVVGLGAGDAVTLWGVSAAGYALDWVENLGAPGYAGLTLHASAAGKPAVLLTLAGMAAADLAGGRLSVGFGSDASSGSDFMHVSCNG